MNNLPRIKPIRVKFFPDRYLLHMTAYISVAFVFLCHVGCFEVTGVINGVGDESGCVGIKK